MRLLTHNQIMCVVRGCRDNFPLLIQPSKVVHAPDDTPVAFTLRILPRLDYPAFRNAVALVVPEAKPLPEALPQRFDMNNENHKGLATVLHKLLLEVHVKEGHLKCSKCDRLYPIRSGIVNLRIREDEI